MSNLQEIRSGRRPSRPLTFEELKGCPKPLISVRQASEVTGIPVSSLYEAIRNGKIELRPVSIGRRIYLPVAPLVRLLEGQGSGDSPISRGDESV